MGKDDFKYLSQTFKKELPSNQKFYSFLTGTKGSKKEYELVIKNWNKFEIKTRRDCYNFYLKCDFLLLVNVSENFIIIDQKIMEHV